MNHSAARQGIIISHHFKIYRFLWTIWMQRDYFNLFFTTLLFCS